MSPGADVNTWHQRLRSRLARWRLRLTLIVRVRAALCWRRLLRRTTFIAITGSLGKTTTRELLHAVLSETGRGSRTSGNLNGDRGVVLALLAARPWHRHCIIEIGVEKPGDMARNARLVRPDVGVLLNVGRCHLKGFGNIQSVLTEKLVLFRHVRRGGTAVLNAGDPLVRGATLPANMTRITFAGWCGGDEAGLRDVSVMTPSSTAETFSTGSQAGPICRLIAATSVWPEPLTVEIEQSDGADKPPHRVCFTTALHGEHWANAVVAVVATARTLGRSNHDIAGGLSRVPNWSRRLEPVLLAARQATYVRDEYNGSIETYRSSLAWLGQARASRRLVIYADASDMKSVDGPRRRIRDLTRMVAANADHLVPITAYPDTAVQAARSCGLDAVQVTPLNTLHDAIDWCRATLRPGDLVLCKGRTNRKLERIYLGLFAEVACQRETCALKRDCKDCPELGFEVTSAMLDGTARVLAATHKGTPVTASTDSANARP